jgi:ectoine hydroxylase-related dioxygenase (phytanoyl-CoA dioxygenase family)
MTFTEAQLKQYEDDGYIFPIDVLTPAEVAACRASLEAVEAKQDGKLLPSQRPKSHLLFKWLDDMIRDPRILDPIEELIGPNILCWNTIFWIKDAGLESFVSWHQDNRYWGLSSDNVITAWLALSQAQVENGCMRVMPGTHKGDVLHHEDRFHDDNMLTRGQEITEGVDDATAVHMPLAPGQMSIHNYRAAHASGPNLGSDRRIGVSMHFMPVETQQTVTDWDSAALVRGKDPYRAFEHTPRVLQDLDPAILPFHAKAADTVNRILYDGAEANTAKL